MLSLRSSLAYVLVCSQSIASKLTSFQNQNGDNVKDSYHSRIREMTAKIRWEV